MAEPIDPSLLEAFLEGQPTAWFIGAVVRDVAGRGLGWRFLRVNGAWEKLTGKRRDEGEGRLNTELFPGTSDDWLTVFAEMVDAGHPTRFTRRTKLFDGWFEVHAFPLEGELFAANFTDATARVAAQEARSEAEADLHAAKDLLANVFRQAPAYMCALRGEDYVFEIANERFLELVGGRDVVGEMLLSVLPEAASQGIVAILDGVREADETYVGIDRRVSFWSPQERQSVVRFMDFVCVPLHGADGTVTGILFHGVDQTARKRAEDELRDVASELSEMDRRKSDFLATLAHELRNPLAPLRNGLQILRMAGANETLSGRARDMMERQVTHLVRLVDDLLDVARISGGKIELRKEQCLLQDVVARAIETSSPALDARSHSLDVRGGEAPIQVCVDPTRLAQVLANLLTNAAKYTPPGGAIGISTRTDGANAFVEVSDNGVGIPVGSLSTLFDMFSQVKENLAMAQGGLGIGLALSRRLVELHDGTIDAHSDGPGTGSRFVVTLPLSEHVSSNAIDDDDRINVALVPQGTPRLRVLIVDDNLDAGDSLATRLELAGHEARLARDGAAGLIVAREFQPDIAFLDIGMPGMNGYELARAIRQADRCDGAMLIALTGWGARRDVERAQKAGFDGHLTKPAPDGEVERFLAEASRRSLRDPPRAP